MNDTKTRTATWVKIVLTISLALNLAVVGMLAGASLRKPPAHVRNIENSSILARALPFKYQTQLRGAIRERREDLKPDREAMRALRVNLINALNADPFDISAVEAVFSDQRDLLTNLVFAGHGEVIAQIAKMNARDRARYIENLQKPPRGPRQDGQ